MKGRGKRDDGDESLPNGIGLGVDARGGPVIDPTANVIELVKAVDKRQDDLRETNNTWLMKWLDRELLHMDQMAILRAEHEEARAKAEAGRIDANRQFDMLGVNTAAERQIEAVKTLAAATATSATNLATQTANTFSAVVDRLAALERTSYEGKGKEAVADPMIAALVQEVKNFTLFMSKGTGGQEMWVRVAMFIGMGAALYAAFRPH